MKLLMNQRRVKPVWVGLMLLVLISAGCDKIFGSSDPRESLMEGTVNRTLDLDWNVEVEGDRLLHAPQLAGDLLMVVANDALTALDTADGDVVWRFVPPGDDVRIWGGSMQVYGDKVFIGTQGGLYFALNAKTGDIVWKVELGVDTVKAPLVYQNQFYLITTRLWPPRVKNHELFADLIHFDPQTGKVVRRWTSENFILTAIATDGEKIYVGGNYHAPRESDESGHQRIYALEFLEGDFNVAWTYESSDGNPKSLFAGDGVLNYLGYEDYIVGLDTRTGESLWRTHTGNWSQGFRVSGRLLSFSSALSKVVTMDRITGEVIWQHKLPNPQHFGTIIGTPIIVDTRAYWVTNLERVFSVVDFETGDLRWSAQTGLSIGSLGEPLMAGDRLYLVGAKGDVWAYDIVSND